MSEVNRPNRLAASNSPYLLQHALNPVDWYEWGEEPFLMANEQNRLVFLSIGYSTCHWCHVMERESFEDDDVASLLNSAFISIKVDREQRPDLDMIYMDVCQALTGSGGWPLTLILTPEKKPIFAGTYFPKRQKYGRPGLIEILAAINAVWQTEPEKLLSSAEKITRYFLAERSEAGIFPHEKIVDDGGAYIERDFDEEYGGFSPAPKFPMGHVLSFLLNNSAARGLSESCGKVYFTLKKMALGGIHDHVGGGFCRYSTDARWLVPHFEKMLYDNALILRVYCEAYRLTADQIFKSAAESICSYVLRDLTSDGGGFYSAEDADSEGQEGRYYVFTYDEFVKIAGKDFEILAEFYGVTEKGNFEHATNILSCNETEGDFCIRHGIDGESFKHSISQFRSRLFKFREKRLRPSLDDKVIVSWNGLMIGALAFAGRILNRSDLIECAAASADFVKNYLFAEDSGLKRFWRKGKAEGYGFFEDYAFLIHGLIELYRSNFNPELLSLAVNLTDAAAENFKGRLPGEYYETPAAGERLLFRPVNRHDGAVPSARAVFADACVTLHVLTEKQKYADMAAAIFADSAELMARVPSGTAFMLNAMRRFYRRPARVVISGSSLAAAEAFIAEVDRSDIEICLIVCLNEQQKSVLSSLIEIPQQLECHESIRVTVCKNNFCLPPVFDLKAMKETLEKV